MGITLKEIAASIDAQLTGDPELEIEGVSSFEDATGNDI